MGVWKNPQEKGNVGFRYLKQNYKSAIALFFL